MFEYSILCFSSADGALANNGNVMRSIVCRRLTSGWWSTNISLGSQFAGYGVKWTVFWLFVCFLLKNKQHPNDVIEPTSPWQPKTTTTTTPNKDRAWEEGFLLLFHCNKTLLPLARVSMATRLENRCDVWIKKQSLYEEKFKRSLNKNHVPCVVFIKHSSLFTGETQTGTRLSGGGVEPILATVCPLSMSGFASSFLWLSQRSQCLFHRWGRGGGYLPVYEHTHTNHTQARTHTHIHTAKEATPQEGRRTEDGWNKGPSADSGGDDDVPVCPLRQGQLQSWQGNGQSAPPGVGGMGCQSDTPPHHQALLPGS